MATKSRKPMNLPDNDINQENQLPDEISEMLEGVPEPKRQNLVRVMEAQFSMISRVSPEIEISKKITGDHITTMLQNQNKAMDLQHKDQWQRMLFYGFIVLILLIAVFGIIFLLKDIPEIMERVLTVLVTAIISGLGGYGIGSRKRNGDD